MKTPEQHAEESAQIFGGKAKDYLPIHKFLDQASNEILHALTHNDWFVGRVLPEASITS